VAGLALTLVLAEVARFSAGDTDFGNF